MKNETALARKPLVGKHARTVSPNQLRLRLRSDGDVSAPGTGFRRKCFFRAAVMLLGVALLLVAELVLRLLHCGYPTDYFIKSQDGQFYRENRQFGWQFFPHESAIIPNPVRFPVIKRPGTFRVFILGESAAAGSPNAAFGFGRILELMLEHRYPERQFEVVNAGMRGIDSHVVARITQECARLAPDLFIVYMGNNEFVAFHTGETPSRFWAHFVRLRPFAQWLRSLKLSQLAQRLAAHTETALSREPPWDMAFFRKRRLSPDPTRREPVYDEFRRNVSRICDRMTASQAPALVCSVGVNLRDCPPLGSLHRAGLTGAAESVWQARYAAGVEAQEKGEFDRAVACYGNALGLDSQYAELHYRLAQCYLATGHASQALLHFSAARDCDALQFRGDTRVNAVLREEATRRHASGLHWVDVEQGLRDNSASDGGIPGDRLFFDPVHLRFEGNYEVACILFPAVVSVLGLPDRAGPMLSRQDCAELLAYNRWDESNLEQIIFRITARPPFLDQCDHASRQADAEQRWRDREQRLGNDGWAEALATYRRAVARRPADWQLQFNCGFLLEHLQDLSGAIAQYHRALDLFPDLVNVKVELGAVYVEAGHPDLAIQHLAEAVRIDPHYRRAWQLLAQAAERADTLPP